MTPCGFSGEASAGLTGLMLPQVCVLAHRPVARTGSDPHANFIYVGIDITGGAGYG